MRQAALSKSKSTTRLKDSTRAQLACVLGGIEHDFHMAECMHKMVSYQALFKIFSRLKGISSPTILGVGEVALILDAPSLVQQIVAMN